MSNLVLRPPVLPPAIRAMRVVRAQFITAQHFDAWLVGMPVRRHLKHRKKFSAEERDLYFRHHLYLCSFCPSRSNLTLDHIVPQIFGGSSNEVNLRPCCLPCNLKQWQPFEAYKRAYDRWEKAA